MKGLKTVFVGACAVAGCTLLMAIGLASAQAWKEYKQVRSCEEALNHKFDTLQATLESKKHYLEVLQSDPLCAERIARQRLGYVRQQEWVFYFEK